jgi:O-antigen ligase
MDRLSGAPHDIINPNGLAFVIDTIIPFIYFLSFGSRKWAVAALISLPICLYALVLTGSRSGLIGLATIIVGIFIKSKHRVVIAILCLLISIVGFAKMNPDQKDRYLSIFESDTKNAVTARERIEGITNNLKIVLRRPVFGHGIGTSREANANFGKEDQPAHDLYAETAQEIGIVGLGIFIVYISSIVKNVAKSWRMLKQEGITDSYSARFANAMQVWLFMNIVFSLASYGLSSYEWYLLGGLSVVIVKLSSSEEMVSEYESHPSFEYY